MIYYIKGCPSCQLEEKIPLGYNTEEKIYSYNGRCKKCKKIIQIVLREENLESQILEGNLLRTNENQLLSFNQSCPHCWIKAYPQENQIENCSDCKKEIVGVDIIPWYEFGDHVFLCWNCFCKPNLI